MEPSIFIPHFLRACLFALLPGKDTAERSEQPEEGGSRSLPICSFIFRLLNSIIQQNWAPRKTSTSSHQIWEHGTDELRSAAARVADVAALCRGSQLSWGSPCVSVFRVSWLFLGVPSPGSRPRCRGGVGVSPCWDSASVAKNGSMQEDTAGHAPSPGHPQNVRVKVLAGLGVFSAAVICFVLKQVNPYGNALWCLCAPYCISHANTAAKPT